MNFIYTNTRLLNLFVLYYLGFRIDLMSFYCSGFMSFYFLMSENLQVTVPSVLDPLLLPVSSFSFEFSLPARWLSDELNASWQEGGGGGGGVGGSSLRHSFSRRGLELVFPRLIPPTNQERRARSCTETCWMSSHNDYYDDNYYNNKTTSVWTHQMGLIMTSMQLKIINNNVLYI